MNLSKLKVFAHVANHGSLTKAAITLDTTQSTISRQINALEREYGARLFHRTGRGVILTPFGERILPRVRTLLSNADQLMQDVQSTGDVPVGDVQLGILPSVVHPLVSSLFRDLRKYYPGIRLHVHEGSGGQIEEWLSSGRIDVGILFRYGKAHAMSSPLLARSDAYLVGATNDPVTQSPTVQFARLQGLPLVLASPPNRLRALLDQISRRKHFTLSVLLETDSLAIQKNVVAEAQAYTILALNAVYREVQSGRLQASRIVNPTIDRVIILRTTTSHPLTQASREVARLITKLAGPSTGQRDSGGRAQD